MFLLLMMSRYFFMSPSFFRSSPSHFSISARKTKTDSPNIKKGHASHKHSSTQALLVFLTPQFRLGPVTSWSGNSDQSDDRDVLQVSGSLSTGDLVSKHPSELLKLTSVSLFADFPTIQPHRLPFSSGNPAILLQQEVNTWSGQWKRWLIYEQRSAFSFESNLNIFSKLSCRQFGRRHPSCPPLKFPSFY